MFREPRSTVSTRIRDLTGVGLTNYPQGERCLKQLKSNKINEKNYFLHFGTDSAVLVDESAVEETVT